MTIKHTPSIFLLSACLFYFQSATATEAETAKVVKHQGDLVLLLKSPYSIDGATVSLCKFKHRAVRCYILKKAESIQMPIKP